MSWSESKTEAWCSTKVDRSGKHIFGHEGFCEQDCQPKISPDDNNESKKGGKDSSTILIVVTTISILIILSIIMSYYCYVKRNRGRGENSKYINFNYLFNVL